MKAVSLLCLMGCAASPVKPDVPCHSFEQFAAVAQRELDELLQRAPGEQLVSGVSHLNAARRACAQHVIRQLRQLRETQGVNALQQELDAMARSFEPEVLQRLLVDALGSEASQLRPLVAEATARATAAPLTLPATESWECPEFEPCRRLQCQAGHQRWVEGTARDCLRSTSTLDTLSRVTRLAEFWPYFPPKPSAATDEVEKLRATAQQHHLRAAQTLTSFPAAAWLHRRTAQEFGAPPAEWVGDNGRWDSPRWTCSRPMPTLPPLPSGMEGFIQVRCDTPVAPALQTEEAMRTFDLEREMRAHTVSGHLQVRCAGQGHRYPINTDLDSWADEVSRLVGNAAETCVRLHRLAASSSCAQLGALSEGEVLTRFVYHAQFTGQWEPCFQKWWGAQQGTPLTFAPPTRP
jgi:hypothetical protein